LCLPPPFLALSLSHLFTQACHLQYPMWYVR
jgi:hypothetical protein